MNRLPTQSVPPYEMWEATAKEFIELEMVRRRIGYKELAGMLGELGIEESPKQINRKVNRQRFSAAFMLACLSAMGATISVTQK